MKVGRSVGDDVRRAALIREEIGWDRALMMDANQVWDVDEAIAHMKPLARFQPRWIEEPTNPDDVRALYMAANGMVGLGLMERGREFAARARTMRPDDPMTLYNLGCIYACTGAVDEAFDCLHAAVDHGLTQRGWFENDGDLARVRRDARFSGLLARLP